LTTVRGDIQDTGVRSQSEQIRVGLIGLGTIGRNVAELLGQRDGIEVVAAADKVAQELPGYDIEVAPDARAVIDAQPDVVVQATGSFIRDVLDDVVYAAEHGVNVVSPCEELAFPFPRHTADAERIAAAATAGRATVLGTGVNPGFMFDTLLAVASGTCWDVASVRGRRVVDVSGFGEAIHSRLGIGYTRESFDAGHEDGSIAGHVGFQESIAMVADRFGLTLDGPVHEEFEPFVAESPAPTTYGAVEEGRTEGFIQRATGSVGGKPLIQLELVLHLRPREAGFDPADSIEIDGRHPVRLTLNPGMDAILATSAVLVNCIPVVLAAEPGLKAVTDLPVTAAWFSRPMLR
jgi:2,4-diaminopentanoate dehydrogenase